MSSQSPGTPPETISGQLRDSISGVPGICAIWMWVRRSVTEYTIWGMVVASPESGPWWVLWSEVPMACPNTKRCLGKWTNHLGGLFWCRFKLDQLSPLPSLSLGSQLDPLPLSRVGSRERATKSQFRNLTLWNPQVGFTPVTWERVTAGRTFHPSP
jgi:hypothetical protein